MRRLPSLVVSMVVAALVLAGCGSGPNRLGAAAIVGDQVIPVDLVQQRLRAAAPDLRAAADRRGAQPGTPPGARLPTEVLASQSRRLLTVSVLHRLVAEESRRQGIAVPPQRVDALLARAGGAQAAAAGSGFDAATIRELVADQVAVAEIGRRSFDRLAVTVDYATVPTRAAADDLARRIAADPADAGAALAGLPAGSSATGLTLRPGSSRGAGAPSAASSLLFGLPDDTVTVTSSAREPQGAGSSAPDPSTQPWTVIHVTDRTLAAPPPGPGTVPAARVDDDTMINFGLRLLQPLALELGVTVNPRYGTWDPTQLAVVADPAAAGRIQPVSAGQAP